VAATSTVRLFDIEPDLLRFLSGEDCSEAAELHVPTSRLARGKIELTDLLRDGNAFAAIVLDGILLQSIQLCDQVGLRLLGPGDILGLSGEVPSSLRVGVSMRSETTVTVALLGNEMLVAAHRWPRLVAGLFGRLVAQSERIADQLVICQLPRVEDRIQAIMWQLAEAWGYVTGAGTVVPLTLTHELLGGLVGARRSTVTLAIGRLAERGALVRSGHEWLLLEKPSAAIASVDVYVPPVRLESLLESTSTAPDTLRQEWDMIRASVARLHEEHDRAQNDVRERLGRLQSSREQSAAIRHRVERDAIRRRRAPSAR
jgi:CRP/FNR family transcriptional regulator, cyclic AMP receptor protein